MVRQLKSRQQLLALLQDSIQRKADLGSIRPAAVATRTPDATGCNWDVTQWSDGPALAPRARRELAALVSDLKSRYNAIAVAAK